MEPLDLSDEGTPSDSLSFWKAEELEVVGRTASPSDKEDNSQSMDDDLVLIHIGHNVRRIFTCVDGFDCFTGKKLRTS